MKRAVVIRTVGDAELGSAIAEGMSCRVIPLDTGELEAVRAEVKRLEAVNGVRARGDTKRWAETKAEMARMYPVRRPGPVRETLLLAWAMLWMEIYEAFEYLSAWNRG